MAFLGHQVICFDDFSDCQFELFLSESAYFVKTPCFLDIFWQCWCVFSITLTLVDWMDVMVCTKTVPRASRADGCGNTNVADTDEPPNQVGYSKTFSFYLKKWFLPVPFSLTELFIRHFLLTITQPVFEFGLIFVPKLGYFPPKVMLF